MFCQNVLSSTTVLSTICVISYLESIVVMDCTGIADASTEFEFKIVEFSPMVTAYLFEAGRDYYYIGKFAHFQFSHMISQNLKFSSLKCTKIIYRLNSEKF